MEVDYSAPDCRAGKCETSKYGHPKFLAIVACRTNKGPQHSGLQGSSCALSVTVMQLFLIYKLQRLVTLSAFLYIWAFVFVILRNCLSFWSFTFIWLLCEFGPF